LTAESNSDPPNHRITLAVQRGMPQEMVSLEELQQIGFTPGLAKEILRAWAARHHR
jgi:hypothetical protein